VKSQGGFTGWLGLGNQLKKSRQRKWTGAVCGLSYVIPIFDPQMRPLKKYAALFLLAVFAWPFVEKSLHEIEHAADEHCTDKSAAHYHELEHQCSLCDFEITAPLEHAAPTGTPALLEPVYISFFTFDQDFLLAPAFSFSLRGPPAV
jgi:hypothetical protein